MSSKELTGGRQRLGAGLKVRAQAMDQKGELKMPSGNEWAVYSIFSTPTCSRSFVFILNKLYFGPLKRKVCCTLMSP